MKEEQFKTTVARADLFTNEAAAEIRSLCNQIKGQGLPADVEERVVAGLNAVAEKLKGIGKEDIAPEGAILPGEEVDTQDEGEEKVDAPTT